MTDSIYETELKDIPDSIKHFLDRVIQNDKLYLPNIKTSRHTLKGIAQIILTGTGQSYFSAQAMAHNMELLTDLPTQAIPAPLLMGTRGVLYRDVLVIAVSLDGDDNDTICAVKRANANSARIIAVTRPDSPLGKMCKSKVVPAECGDGTCTFQSEYLAIAMLGIHIGNILGRMSKINMSVALKLAQMLPGKQSFTSNSQKELQGVGEYISKFSTVIFCGYSTDNAVAKAVAQEFRIMTGVPAFAVPIYDVPTSCTDLDGALIVPIISSNASTKISAYYLNSIKEQCPSTIIYTTKNTAQELGIADGIVTVDDSIPLFNPITILTALEQTILEIYTTPTTTEKSA